MLDRPATSRNRYKEDKPWNGDAPRTSSYIAWRWRLRPRAFIRDAPESAGGPAENAQPRPALHGLAASTSLPKSAYVIADVCKPVKELTTRPNHLARLAGRGREPRAARRTGEGQLSAPPVDAARSPRRPSPRPSPRQRGEGVSRGSDPRMLPPHIRQFMQPGTGRQTASSRTVGLTKMLSHPLTKKFR
jgi:hypothetical protein